MKGHIEIPFEYRRSDDSRELYSHTFRVTDYDEYVSYGKTLKQAFNDTAITASSYVRNVYGRDIKFIPTMDFAALEATVKLEPHKKFILMWRSTTEEEPLDPAIDKPVLFSVGDVVRLKSDPDHSMTVVKSRTMGAYQDLPFEQGSTIVLCCWLNSSLQTEDSWFQAEMLVGSSWSERL